jgi:hypothetical protein
MVSNAPLRPIIIARPNIVYRLLPMPTPESNKGLFKWPMKPRLIRYWDGKISPQREPGMAYLVSFQKIWV